MKNYLTFDEALEEAIRRHGKGTQQARDFMSNWCTWRNRQICNLDTRKNRGHKGNPGAGRRYVYF